MIKSTYIARLSNGLPLVETIDDEDTLKEFPGYKKQIKDIIKSLSSQSDTKVTIESGPFYFHYLIDQGVCYICISERLFPKALAFSFLEEVAQKFYEKYGKEVEAAQRPYAFIQFETDIEAIKKTFKDSKNQQNLARLNEELRGVTKIMTKNIQDVLQRGEKLEKLNTYSSLLASGAKDYSKQTRHLNLQLLYEKYGTFFILLTIILLIILYYWSFS